jgi:hypothetical protein
MEYEEYKERFIKSMKEIIGEQSGDLEVHAKASWEIWSDPEEHLQGETPEQMAEAEIECWD